MRLAQDFKSQYPNLESVMELYIGGCSDNTERAAGELHKASDYEVELAFRWTWRSSSISPISWAVVMRLCCARRSNAQMLSHATLCWLVVLDASKACFICGSCFPNSRFPSSDLFSWPPCAGQSGATSGPHSPSTAPAMEFASTPAMEFASTWIVLPP